MKKVSVIIANRNDTAMLSVTVNSCIEELLPIGLNKAEIIICDNSDKAIYDVLGSCLPIGYMRDKNKLLKVFRQDEPCLFTARETAIKKSEGIYTICLDSHVMSGRNMLRDMVRFMEKHHNDKTIGFAHAPINWSNHHIRNARHDRNLSKHELGDWNSVYNTERTITWKGMPWICKRDWFLNQLNGYGALAQHAVSWGGGDMHIGTKPWLLGYKNWAVPCRPAIHIGPFPKIDHKSPNRNEVEVAKGDGYRYRLWSNSGKGPHAIGFLISCYVLGGEAMMERNKAAIGRKFGRFIDVEKWWDRAKEYGKEEKEWLDANKVMTYEEYLENKPWNQS